MNRSQKRLESTHNRKVRERCCLRVPRADRLKRALASVAALLILCLGSGCSRPFPDDDLVLGLTLYGVNVAALRRFFVSQGSYQGNALSGVSGADSRCASDASNPGGAVYRALLVDGPNRVACVNADCSPTNSGDGLGWVLEANTTYYRIEGNGLVAVFTTNASRIVAFPSSSLSAGGFTASTSDEWWTGMNQDWQATGVDCADWGGGVTGAYGQGGNTDDVSILFGGAACGSSRRLICVQQ